MNDKIKDKKKEIELMAPAGSYEALRAAIQAGADSVYFGIGPLNMRARAANNFTLRDLNKIVAICRQHQVKAYLTLNTIIYDQDIAQVKKICAAAKKAGLTAVICTDIAAIAYARSLGLPVHLSTQANISNFEAVKFYAQFAEVIVLARELTLPQIKYITQEIKKHKICGPSGKLVKIELFIHGALCVSIAGKCYMSLATYNHSANRGACLQNCRRAYRVIDDETGDELKIENEYVMSPKDLCTIGCMDKILRAGVTILKIEGRGRSPEYVYTTVKAYREAVDSYLQGTYNLDKIQQWTKALETVFNRGFWHGGYYLGKKLGEWSGSYGSQATKKKIYTGIVKNYFNKPKIAEFYLEAGAVKVGDEIMITGPTTGIIQTKITSICIELNGKDTQIQKAKKGEQITIPIDQKVRPNDKLFVMVDAETA